MRSLSTTHERAFHTAGSMLPAMTCIGATEYITMHISLCFGINSTFYWHEGAAWLVGVSQLRPCIPTGIPWQSRDQQQECLIENIEMRIFGAGHSAWRLAGSAGTPESPAQQGATANFRIRRQP